MNKSLVGCVDTAKKKRSNSFSLINFFLLDEKFFFVDENVFVASRIVSKEIIDENIRTKTFFEIVRERQNSKVMNMQHSKNFLVFGDDWINQDYVKNVSRERVGRSRSEYRYRVLLEVGSRREERVIYSDYDAPQLVSIHDVPYTLHTVQEKSTHAARKRNRLGF